MIVFRNKLLSVASLALVLAVIYIFYFHRLDLIQDLPRNICSTGAFNIKLAQARYNHQTMPEMFAYFYQRWSNMGGIFYPGMAEWYALSIPLTQSLLFVFFKLFTPSAWTIIIASSAVSSSAILTTFWFGTKLFKPWIGALASIMMAVSIFIFVPSRIGYIFFSLEPLLGAAFASCLYFAHRRKDFRLLLATAFLFTLGCFNGHTAFIFSMPVFFLLIAVWDLLKDHHFKFWQHLASAFTAGFCYLLFRLGYTLFFGGSWKLAIKGVYLGFLDRSSQIATVFNGNMSILDNGERFIRLMFVKSEFGKIGPDAWYLFLPGKPMLPYLVSVGLLLGIVAVVRRRDFLTRFLLLWLFIPIIIFTLLIHFDARYIMASASAIFIISSYGIVRLAEKTIRQFKRFTFVHPLVMGVLAVLLVLTVKTSYEDLYNDYILKKDGMLMREMGLVQAGRYIKETANPQNTLIILGDRNSVLEYCIDFGSGMSDYVYTFWDNIVFDNQNLRQWEDGILKEKTAIYYIFSPGLNFYEMPGTNYYPLTVGWDNFYALHPGIQPIKEINFSTGVPAIKIFKVSRPETANSKQVLPFLLSGPLKNSFIKAAGQQVVWPVNLFRGQTMIVSYSPSDILLLKPLADYGPSQFFRSENVKFVAGDEGYVALDREGEGYFVIKLEAPGEISEVEVVTNPKFFNDLSGINSVAGYNSYSDRNYAQFFEVKSDRSEKWTFGRTTYYQFHPNAREYYLKFVLRGQADVVRYWLNKYVTISIQAKVSTDSLDKLYPVADMGQVMFKTETADHGQVVVLDPLPVD